MANENLKTLEDKLSYAYDTKIAIHDAIVAKGIDIPEGTVFRDYAAKIGEIESGGSVQLVSGTVTTGRGAVSVYYTDGSSTLKDQVVDGTINVEINTLIYVWSDFGHTVGGNAVNAPGSVYFVTGDFTVAGK